MLCFFFCIGARCIAAVAVIMESNRKRKLDTSESNDIENCCVNRDLLDGKRLLPTLSNVVGREILVEGYFTSNKTNVNFHGAGSKWLQMVNQLNNWKENNSSNWYCAKQISFGHVKGDSGGKRTRLRCRMRLTINMKITDDIINCGDTKYPFKGYVSLYSTPSDSEEIITSDYDYHNCEMGRLTEFLLEYCDLRQAIHIDPKLYDPSHADVRATDISRVISLVKDRNTWKGSCSGNIYMLGDHHLILQSTVSKKEYKCLSCSFGFTATAAFNEKLSFAKISQTEKARQKCNGTAEILKVIDYGVEKLIPDLTLRLRALTWSSKLTGTYEFQFRSIVTAEHFISNHIFNIFRIFRSVKNWC